jgi:hypothetical protein
MNISTVKSEILRSDKELELAVLEIKYLGLDGQFCCGRKEWIVNREKLVTLARIMDVNQLRSRSARDGRARRTV